MLARVRALGTRHFTFIERVFDGIFSVLIDVMPGDGKTEMGAKFVLKTGKVGIRQLLMDNTKPEEWAYDMMQNSLNYSDWVLRWFLLFWSNWPWLKISKRAQASLRPRSEA